MLERQKKCHEVTYDPIHSPNRMSQFPRHVNDQYRSFRDRSAMADWASSSPTLIRSSAQPARPLPPLPAFLHEPGVGVMLVQPADASASASTPSAPPAAR